MPKMAWNGKIITSYSRRSSPSTWPAHHHPHALLLTALICVCVCVCVCLCLCPLTLCSCHLINIFCRPSKRARSRSPAQERDRVTTKGKERERERTRGRERDGGSTDKPDGTPGKDRPDRGVPRNHDYSHTESRRDAAREGSPRRSERSDRPSADHSKRGSVDGVRDRCAVWRLGLGL